MRPESTSVAFRADLAAFAREFISEKALKNFIGMRAAPVFGVPEAEGGYPIFNRENFQKMADVKRTSRGAYNRIQGEFGRGTYDCEEHGLEHSIDDRMRRRYARLFDAEKAATEMLIYQILLAHEYRVATLYSGGGWTNTNVSTAWSTAASAVPINDIQTQLDNILDATGVPPEDCSIIIPRADYLEMIQTAQIADLTKYTYPGVQPAVLNSQQIANILGVKQVLVGRAAYDSKEEGITPSFAQLWTAGVIYVCVLAEPEAPLESPSAARTIMWEGDAGEIPVVETYREDKTRSDVVRVRDDTDEILMGATDLFVRKLTNT